MSESNGEATTDPQLQKVLALQEAFKGLMKLAGDSLDDERAFLTPEKVYDEAYKVLDAVEKRVTGKDRPSNGFEPQGLKELSEIASAISLQDRIPFGIPGLNAVIGGGMLPGWITVLGAFSGNGKTSLCIFEAVSLATRGHPVLFITAELSAPEVYNRIRVAIGNENDWLPNLKVVYPECDIFGISQGIKAWVESHDGCEAAPIIVIDYLQKLKAQGKQFSREREVAVIAEELQSIGRKYGVPLIVAAQLNRQSQADDVPKLHHLRESGLIEQIADIALLVQKTDSNRMSLTVAKNRWGTSDGNLDISVDFANYRFGTVSPIQMYLSLAEEVVSLVKESGRELPCRTVMQQTRFNKKHPTKMQLIEAGAATQLFMVVDSKIVLST